ncbi:2,3-dihydro-2,3-dihydroxybenzoate dehydrogenase [Agaribacterium sp. ZY112]|uniref:2,3-dihydro-2,3-dihydroxybenzoate dehydrogenase n=1 Tax=Agaribacterium sp. ZY112 TaxID=3233574 RepID=UPI003524EC41
MQEQPVTDSSAFNFSDKRIWVTGAGRGIGLETAKAFCQAGATVTGFDLAFEEQHYPFSTCLLDLRSPEQIACVCQDKLNKDKQVDVLVNAAGVLRLGNLDELSGDDWQACLDVNVSSVFYLVQQLNKTFKQQKNSVIINIASNAARVPRMKMAAYCASKAALESLSHCIGLELAEYGVRCNLVSPGSTNTPMLQSMLADEDALARTLKGSLATYKNGIPLGKLAQPKDIASSVLFLASDMAGHITLQNLVIDGGATLSA